MTAQKTPVWTPSDPGDTNVAKFIQYVNKKRSLDLRTYHDLHQWSVDSETLQDFWRDAYEFLELRPRHLKASGDTLETKVHIANRTKNE
jgi:hypothetical protein